MAVTSENQPSHRVDAFSVRLPDGSHRRPDRPVVVLGASKASIMRRRFNAAHELGHVLLHADPVPGDSRQEREANTFAAELLAPAAQVTDVLPRRPDLDKLLAVQQEWGVSVAALLMRGRDIGVYSESALRTAMIALNTLGWRRAEPGDTVAGEWPVMLRRAAELAADCGFTIADLADAVRLPVRRVRSLLSIVEDDRVTLTLVTS